MAEQLTPDERLERAWNTIAAVATGHTDVLMALSGDRRADLLRRLRTANGHLVQLEKALMAQAAEGSAPSRRAGPR